MKSQVEKLPRVGLNRVRLSNAASMASPTIRRAGARQRVAVDLMDVAAVDLCKVIRIAKGCIDEGKVIVRWYITCHDAAYANWIDRVPHALVLLTTVLRGKHVPVTAAVFLVMRKPSPVSQCIAMPRGPSYAVVSGTWIANCHAAHLHSIGSGIVAGVPATLVQGLQHTSAVGQSVRLCQVLMLLVWVDVR